MITQLAQEKDFAALSPAERAQVLAEMSREDYDQLRKVLRTSRDMDAQAHPPAALRARLMDRMTAQNPSPINRILSAKVPVWQAAAALLLAVAAVAMLKKDVVVEKAITHWQVRVDTVFQERVVWRDRVVVWEKVVFREKTPEQPMALIPENKDSQLVVPNYPEVEWTVTPRLGTSLGDTPELMSFFTQGK